MEVLHGNQSEPGQARRKQDQQPSDQRTLDWSSHPCDVLLRPHSPLALADVLSHPGGCFDLVALPSDENTDLQPANESLHAESAVSLQQRRQRKHPRARANLLTCHSPDELMQRCKRVLVENALVKKRGLKRLFLTAGFLSWPDVNDPRKTCHSPLLFYPAILVRKINDLNTTKQGASESVKNIKFHSDDAHQQATAEPSVEGNSYEIRLESATPDMNPVLLDRCRAIAGIELPVFDANIPLQDYFTQVAAAISKAENISLKFEIALGTAATPINLASKSTQELKLPELPTHFNASLATAITGNKNLRELHAVLHLLQDYGATAPLHSDKLPAANESNLSISRIREYSEKLAANGLDHIEFQHLPGLPANLESWIGSAQKALSSELVCKVLKQRNISPRHLNKIAGLIELIDKSPHDIDQFRHPDLCFSATPLLFRRARHQAHLIEEEITALQAYFVLDKIPAKKQLLSLIEELGASISTGPDVVDADYFNARRQFMEFSIEKPANLTQEHRRLLGQLAKVLRFRELFVNNTEYRLALGPGYRGLRTDWQALEGMLDYAREFSEFLESETLAATVIGHWATFRATFVDEFETLTQAADGLRKLLRVAGPNWQALPTPRLIEKARDLGTQLRAWDEIYGQIDSHGNRTPASLLAQFTGKSRDDILTEIQVGETQVQIQQHLSAGQSSREAVVDTLYWLREASQIAAENELEIDAIVDHLQIA